MITLSHQRKITSIYKESFDLIQMNFQFVNILMSIISRSGKAGTSTFGYGSLRFGAFLTPLTADAPDWAACAAPVPHTEKA